MYWGIYSSEHIQHLKLKGKRPILIRALEPLYKEGKIPYEIPNINKYIDVLELYFDDITDERVDKKFVLFNRDMSYKLIDFINKNEFDEIVVHCAMGISRSSALMICISKILNLPQIEEVIIKSNRFNPNKLVLKIFSECTIINTKKLNSEFVKELKSQSVADLQAQLVEAKKELFNLRFQNATNQLDNTARINVVRKNIARIQTVISEKEAE